ncbi:MAG: hypothetical protein QW076_02440 [Candidatus Anstonellales archaeon]
MIKPLISFHANFNKVSGPLVTGESKVVFDVPELFENEIEGIVRLLKKQNLLIVIYNSNDYVEENTAKTENE